MTPHRFSGWPGAWCLDCGIEDQTEICVASHSHVVMDPEKGICVVPCQNPPCAEPGSNRNNPYGRRREEDSTVVETDA